MGERLYVKPFVLRIKQFLCTREGILFLALLLGAIAIRIPLMQFQGYYADLSTYIRWGELVNQHFTSIYTTTLATTARNGSGFGGGGFPGGGGGFPGGGNGGPGGGNGGFG